MELSREKVLRKQEEIVKLDDKFNRTFKDLSDTQAKLTESTELISSLELELKTLHETGTDKQNDEIRILESQVAEQTEINSRFFQRNEVLSQKILDLRNEISDSESERNTRLLEELREQKEELDECKQKAINLNVKLNDKDGEIEDLKLSLIHI